jgi:hypothetical protein
VRIGDCGQVGRPRLGLALSLPVLTIACRADGAGLDVSLAGASFTEEEILDGVL